MDYSEFAAPQKGILPICPGIVLGDKYSLSDDPNIIKCHNITRAIAILPEVSDVSLYVPEHIPSLCIAYHNTHVPTISNEEIKQYDTACALITNEDTTSNCFVFCNNGYQRSIPFLCYCLQKIGVSSNSEEAINRILSQPQSSDVGSQYGIAVGTLFESKAT